MVNTPVLYITFARPEYASQSFAAIKKAQPKKLYFYSNKARADKPDEVRRNEEVRSYVNQIDWDCEIVRWFRDEYVDVFTSLWGAIDWVFQNEEEAIVIEEDVVTCPAFFDYMDKLIVKYRDNEKVWIISGDNALPQKVPNGLSYFPTKFLPVFGWASWANRWNSLDREMVKWPIFRDSTEFHNYYDTIIQRYMQRKYFDYVYRNIKSYNAWDYIFNYNMALNNGYCLIPFLNLVSDIGVSGANHSYKIRSPYSRIMVVNDTFPFEIGEPLVLQPTHYDVDYYHRVRFGGVVKRKLYKYFGFLFRK